MRSVVKAMVVMLLVASGMSSAAQKSNQTDHTTDFYKATLVQAAPGKLLELIRLYQSSAQRTGDIGGASLLWMRHSQGDHWDLLILYPSSKSGATGSSTVERQARKDGLIAEAADRPEKDKNDAAKAAGFGSPGQIGPYLRTLISTHHDTLATAIK